MATHPILPDAPMDTNEVGERTLSREEWWALLNSLFGHAKEMYAEVGGAEAFIRAERAAWDEQDPYR